LRGEEDGDFYTEASEEHREHGEERLAQKTSATEKKEEENPHPQNRRGEIVTSESETGECTRSIIWTVG
jgi:hypothetical protein